jgi:hypothetical protein
MCRKYPVHGGIFVNSLGIISMSKVRKAPDFGKKSGASNCQTDFLTACPMKIQR